MDERQLDAVNIWRQDVAKHHLKLLQSSECGSNLPTSTNFHENKRLDVAWNQHFAIDLGKDNTANAQESKNQRMASSSNSSRSSTHTTVAGRSFSNAYAVFAQFLSRWLFLKVSFPVRAQYSAYMDRRGRKHRRWNVWTRQSRLRSQNARYVRRSSNGHAP